MERSNRYKDPARHATSTFSRESRHSRHLRGIASLIAVGVVVVLLGGFEAAEKTASPPYASTSAATDSSRSFTQALYVASADRTAVGYVAVVLTATKTDAIIGDDGNGIADPGETIRYTVVITNSGDEDATNVQFADTIDPNTTLVAGSINAGPLANNDAYSAIGNVGLTVPAGSGVLANDLDPDGTGLAAVPITAFDNPGTGGGAVSLNTTDGSFTYVPPVGFNGPDTFTYTIDDDEGATAVGTVTITVANLIWFVDNNGGGVGGVGTLTDPFKTVADFNGSTDPAANHNIYLAETGTDYTTGFTLKDGQTLIGEGAPGADLATILGFAVPPFSSPLPLVGGTKPIISNAAGNGINLAANNTVRGLTVGNTSGAGIVGNTVGTLTVSNVSINGSGEAIDIDGGTLAASFDAVSSSGSANQGIDLNNVAGSLAIDGATSLTGIVGEGLDFTGSSAVLSFTGGIAVATTGLGSAGIRSNGGTINIGTTANTISSPTGTAIDVNATSLGGTGWTFAAVSSSGGTGINLNGTTGDFSANAGTITSPSGNAIDINGGTGNFTFEGTVANTGGRSVRVGARPNAIVNFTGAITDSGVGIVLSNNTGSTLNFSGGLDLDTGASDAFSANGGGTLNVTGTNTIDTSTGTGVSISGGTTIGVNGVTFEHISVNGAPSGIALNGTGSGNGGFTVTGTGAGCAQTAVSCTGGALISTTGDAVSLTNAHDVTLNSMLIQTPMGDAVLSDGGSGHALADITIDTPAANGWLATNLGGSNSFGPNGLVTQVNAASTSGISVTNANVNMTLFLIEDSEFTNSTSTATMVQVRQSGTAVIRTEAYGNTFTELAPQALALTTGQLGASTGTHTAIIGAAGASERNTFINAAGTLGGNSLECIAAGGGTMQCKVENNLFDNVAKNGAIANTSVLRTQTSGGNFVGEIRNNDLRNFNFGSGGRHGIGHVNEPSGAAASATSLIIDGNDIDDLTDREAIFLAFRTGSDGGDVTVSNNVIGATGNIGGGGILSDQEAIDFETNNDALPVRLLVENNIISANNGDDEVVFVEAKDNASVDATIRNNNITNTSGGVGSFEVEVEAEDAGAAVCASITGNFLDSGNGRVDLDGGAGTLNITQTSAADVAAVNTIPAGNVVDGGVNAFSVVCQEPSHSPPIAASIIPDGSESVNLAALDEVSVKDTGSAAAGGFGDQLDAGNASPSQFVEPTRKSVEDTALLNDPSADFENQFGLYNSGPSADFNGAWPGASTRVSRAVTVTPPTRIANVSTRASSRLGDAGSNAAPISLNIGTLGAGTSVTITFDVTVNAVVSAGANFIANQGTVTADNHADVLTDDPDTAPANDPTTTLLNAVPDLTLSKDDGGITVMPGDVLAYTLSYQNDGDQGATNVTLTEEVPQHTTFNSTSSTAGWTCPDAAPAGSACTINVGSVVGGGGNGSATFALNVDSPIAAGTSQISNTASVLDDETNGADPTPLNNDASDTTPVDAMPVVGATKVDLFLDDGNSDGVANPGESIKYTVVVANTGNENAALVTFDDPAAGHPNTTLIAGTVTTTQGTITSGNSVGHTNVAVDLGTLIGGGGPVTITFKVTIDDPFPAGTAEVCNQGRFADSFPDVLTDDPDTADSNDPTCTVVVSNLAPEIIGIADEFRTVQYSDGLQPVIITATDDNRPEPPADLTISRKWRKGDVAPFVAGLPGNLALSLATCVAVNADSRKCTFTLDGQTLLAAGDYEVEVVVSDGELSSEPDTIRITVETEDVKVGFGANEAAIQVPTDGGSSGPFILSYMFYEFDDPNDISGDLNLAGDISLASHSLVLVPIGPGGNVNPTGCAEGAPMLVQDGLESSFDYLKRTITCTFDGVEVNTYSVEATVNETGYYEGANESVLTIFDPSLGFTTGGGWFIWPNSTDTTNFGFNAKYTKKGNQTKGSLLMIRHLIDGTKYRVKSNAMNSLAVGVDKSGTPFGWGVITGKATYKTPNGENEGNHRFTTYVEDHGTPGGGNDRFWIEVTDKNGTAVALSMDPEAKANAVTIAKGNIVVPQGGGKGKNAKFDDTEIPEAFKLHQNYPNPFGATTILQIDIPEEADVTVAVFDVLGRQVNVLADGVLAAGVHRLTFESSNLPSGLYFARMKTPEGVFVKTMTFVR